MNPNKTAIRAAIVCYTISPALQLLLASLVLAPEFTQAVTERALPTRWRLSLTRLFEGMGSGQL